MAFLIYCDSWIPPRWHHNNTIINTTKNSILVPQAKLSHSGTYNCIGTGTNKQAFVATSIVKVTQG